MRIQLTTIKARFLMPSIIAILVMIGSAIAHVHMVDVATRSAAQAKENQLRSAIYIRLKIAVRRLPVVTLARRQSAIMGLRYADVRHEVEGILQEIRTLPRQGTVARMEATDRLLRLGESSLVLADYLEVNRNRALAHITHHDHGGDLNMQDLRKDLRSFIEIDELIDQELLQYSRTTDANNAARLSWILAVSSILGMLSGVVLMSFALAMLLHRLHQGLRGLETCADAMRSGDFGHRIGIVGDDELAQISRSFNAIAAYLERKQTLVERSRSRLKEIIHRKTKDLASVNRELAAVDERRRLFLADISHELRIPLTIIKGEAQVWLRARPDIRSDPGDVLWRISESATSLQSLVDDLFLIGRAGSGDLTLQTTDLDISDLAAGTVRRFTVIAEERGCDLAMTEGKALHVKGDRERLRQAISILIDNATKHGGKGTQIRVEVRRVGKMAELVVSDNGAGVSPAIRERLFSRLASAGPKRGAGLGLAVASAIAAAHGGETLFEVPESGEGSRFIIRFPVGAAAGDLR